MGGIGSTRWGYGPTKAHTTNYTKVDIGQLKRDGHLECRGRKSLTWVDRDHTSSSIDMLVAGECIGFSYTIRINSGTPVEVSAYAPLEYTSVNLGGRRVWFSCPECEQRCAILYMGGRVACRKCLNLAYQCQSETYADRAIRKANKKANNLGLMNILQPIPPRPKGMHQKTYSQLVAQYHHAQLVALSQIRI